jgi:hypothetical protein
LDIASLQPGAASHPYRFETYSNGVVKFIFDQIMLPDSNVNEPASHGYVKFRIAQKPGNSLGSIILNRAAIYFDFNEPVITNTTHHTIGENFIVVDPPSSLNQGNETRTDQLKVFPNPFTNKAVFRLVNASLSGAQFFLLNSTGKMVVSQTVENEAFIFDRTQLPAGFYFFRFEKEGKILGTGKVVIN